MLQKIRTAVLALLALTAAASAEPVTIAGIVFPDRVGEFTRGAGRDYEKTSPGLGYSFPYRQEPWTATVYVYDRRRTSIPDDVASDVIKAEFAQGKGEILGGVRAGVWRKAELIRDFTLPGRGKARFACASFALVDALDVERDSVLCVTSAKGKFVKFRLTGSRGGSDSAALTFIEAWSRVLWPGA